MTDANYKRLMRRRWLEQFLYKRLWFKRRNAVRWADFIINSTQLQHYRN